MLYKYTRLFQSLYNLISAIFISTALFFVFIKNTYAADSTQASSKKWVGTWSTAPQLVETHNNPPDPGLTNNTLRQIVHVSIGGDSLRIKFSNEFSEDSVKLNSVHIAVSAGGNTIDTTTDKTIYFNGTPQVTMAPGTAVISDPFQFTLQPLSNVAITIYFGETSPDVTGHPGSRTTSYILPGNKVSEREFLEAVTTDHWYVINTIEVMAAPDSAYAVAILGNSITDGRGSGTNKQNRWPDELSRRLQENPATQNVAVLNEGIGGNCVLGACLGPSALSRFNRDVLEQSGVKWAIIFEGINDIGYGAQEVGNNLIDAYKQMIQTAHANNIFVYGATLLPIKGSSYYTEQHEAERQTVNEWIRNSDFFDAVIDFDKALRNPADTLSLLPIADDGDHLHPSETGHRMIAEAVELSLFTNKDTIIYNDESKMIYFEPECETIGEDWNIINDSQASNGKYVTVKPGIQSLNEPPSDSASAIVIYFSIDSAGNYSVFGRLNDPTYDDDSYWVKMDDGEFELFNGLVTSGWEWRKLSDYMLIKGEHILTIAYREDGAKLDKICISNSFLTPIGMGGEAENTCKTTGLKGAEEIFDVYTLKQNYPTPFNPTTVIEYSIPNYSFVSLKVFDVIGNEVAYLVNGMKKAGKYSVLFDGENLSSGVYLYQLKSKNFINTKKFILMK